MWPTSSARASRVHCGTEGVGSHSRLQPLARPDLLGRYALSWLQDMLTTKQVGSRRWMLSSSHCWQLAKLHNILILSILHGMANAKTLDTSPLPALWDSVREPLGESHPGSSPEWFQE
jgi:hypothetical protein